MPAALLANVLYESDPGNGRTYLHAMPVLLGALAVLAIAYRYYSAFLAARVAALDDSRPTPAHRLADGQNYVPTNRWVLFGHHFAAISGAGPLIGPVLALQFGYLPGLLWLVIGVCLAGAVQDMLVLAASVRCGGRSLAEIARTELGRPAAAVASAAILVIVVIALAGLGFVIVKALGGEEVKLPAGMQITLPTGQVPQPDPQHGTAGTTVYRFPGGCGIHFEPGRDPLLRPESFLVRVPAETPLGVEAGTVTLPKGCKQQVPGSSWGTFTIACTIPIALLVGLYMYRIRPGRVVEASLVGGLAVLGATVLGSEIPGSALEPYFSLGREQTILALAVYGAVAALLPVWLLLGPRDYLSSFLKIGTVVFMVLSVCVANPALSCPPITQKFLHGGPILPGSVFPFVFICVMCGSISGFHALVASGTTPKMVDCETDVRPIGYGAMLMEGVVGLMALVAAATLPYDQYLAINIDLDKLPAYQQQLAELYAELGLGPAAADPLHRTNVDAIEHMNLAQVEEAIGGEALRGRTGGAVTLAVGMASVIQQALSWTGVAVGPLLKYWYHFAIMFEALFILTTIDAGNRIARFMLQETLGRVAAPFGRADWLPGAVLTTLAVTVGWAALIWSGSIDTIWPMFGIANQLLAVLALALVTTVLINSGRARYAPLTVLPMLFVVTTTLSAGVQMAGRQLDTRSWLNLILTLYVMATVGALLLLAVSRWVAVLGGFVPARPADPGAEDQSAAAVSG